MAWTALRANEIKARSGASTKGRKMTDPVYCYSLSWAPGEEPSQTQMIEAAKDSLKALGLEHHEALFVGHNDEPHPHIHVVVNRVNPETGIAAPLKMDFLKLSTWAEAFEKQQGQIRCEKRVENNERRKYGEFVKDYDSQHAAEFRRWRHERTERQVRKRILESAVLDARHEKERDDLGRDRDRKIDAKRNQVRDATRSDWRMLYRDQFDQKRALQNAQRNAWSRLRHFVRTHGGEFRDAAPVTRVQMLKNAFSALLGSQRQFAELERKQLAARRAQGKRIKARAEELTKAIKTEHDKKLAQVREKQARERRDQQMAQSRESREQAKEIKEEHDKKMFQAEKDAERMRELAEQKREITKPHPRAADNSLRAKFRQARGRPKVTERAPEEQEKKKGKGGLSVKFRRAKEDQGLGGKDGFKENANDLTTDTGREHSRKPKPPGPRKPD